MARPQIKIDKNEFEKLCAMQCTLDEIAGWFDCSIDTVERWCKREYGEYFAEVHKKKSATGKISLRRTQMKMAEKNASMAIWLGKQYLGQKDVIETQIQGDSAIAEIAKNILDVKKDDSNIG